MQNLHTGETQPLGRFNTSLNGYAPDQYAVTLAGDWVVHAGRGLDRGTATFGPGLAGYSISNPVTSCGATSYVTVCPNWSTTERGVGPPVLSQRRDGGLRRGEGLRHRERAPALWDRSTGPGGPPALTADTVYTATADGLLHAYSVDGSPQNGCQQGTCDPSWSATLGFTPDLSLQPAVAGGVVFVAGAGGEIAAVDAAGCGSPPCAPLWTGSVGSQITGSPAVSNGQLYVGTADGRGWSLRPAGGLTRGATAWPVADGSDASLVVGNERDRGARSRRRVRSRLRDDHRPGTSVGPNPPSPRWLPRGAWAAGCSTWGAVPVSTS